MKLVLPMMLCLGCGPFSCVATSHTVTPPAAGESANSRAPDSAPFAAGFTVERAEWLAKAALNDGDAKALNDLKRSAKSDVAAAWYGLALFDFSSTMFTREDSSAGSGIAQAFALLQRSAARALPASEYRLCWLLGRKMSGPAGWPAYDPAEAGRWCERASDHGVAAANLMLGRMALEGAYLPPCPSPAVDERSAANPSCHRQIAIARLRQAASAGLQRAQFRLGTLLRDEGGSAEEKREGAHWLILAAAHPEQDDDDPWDGRWVRGPDWAAPPASCAAVASVPIPVADLPPEAAVQSLANCVSEPLYYGIGQNADFVNARWCAYLERPAFSHGNGWGAAAFAGPSILAMIYANGEGVARSHSLMQKFACEMGGAPAELTGRTEHLELLAMQANPGAFDVCDDVTSGEMGSNCTTRDGEIADVGRRDRIEEIARRLSRAQQDALRTLLEASQAFFSAQSSGETDQSGSGRAGFIVQQYELDSNTFASLLDKVVASPLAVFPDRAAKASSTQLATTFRTVMKNPANMYPRFGTVVTADIGRAQRAWRRYRDAWITFYQKLYPNQSAAPLDITITRDRLGQLTGFLDH